jgi:hypothetical protein
MIRVSAVKHPLHDSLAEADLDFDASYGCSR